MTTDNHDEQHDQVQGNNLLPSALKKTARYVRQNAKQGAIIWATFPIRLMVPRGVLHRSHKLKKKDVRQVCPSCLSANLVYLKGAWNCPNCKWFVKIPDEDISLLKDYVRQNGHKVKRQLDPDLVSAVVMKRVFASRLLAIVCWMLFIINTIFLIKGKILVFFAGLSILSFLLLTVAYYGYRAWQLATDNLFPVNGRAQFKQYALNNLWIKNPLNNNQS